ncbi:hypothetical protein CERSUDRAFT_115821 [Gelatoporia subvermispora B]|uniref:F-box domain-containing protein n=1 Tax=Ceriporiopsis subvermispora (strain B) TaxID=914234 RepID=M2QV26_CERS8|nr:hypothetical protein CERSUDRAFT_115821 [Gelatoporia subvermispora B]
MSARPRAVFPVEILELIFSDLDIEDFPSIIAANHQFNCIASRCLYRCIPEMKPRRTIGCMKTLEANKDIATLVRTLRINYGVHRPIGNFFRLLHRVLVKTTSLRHFSIELSQHDNHYTRTAWLFQGCRFSLRSLTTSMICDTTLARFLETQHEIFELCLRGFQTTSHFDISPSALPALTTFRAVHVGAPILTEIITGRPVEAVSLSLFPEDGFTPLDALRHSRTPIKRLTVMSLEFSGPEQLIAEVSSRLPQLEALHIVILALSYSNQILLNSSQHLRRFPELRYLTVMAPGSTTTQDEEKIASSWHKACPTLKTIILPKGKVWFERDGKWTCWD